MSNQQLQILFPVGRLVQGDLVKMQTTDADGKPLVIKNGPNAGKPTTRSFFAVAIAKTPGHTHWAQTPWGAQMWAEGAKAWPQGQSGAPTFAWKVEDGDSAIPNTKGRKNCDRPGFPGNWILNFGSGYPPKVVDAKGIAPLADPTAVKLGHFVEVFGSVTGNGSPLKPGIYLNHVAVAYAGFGEEIHLGVDTTKLGMGQGALPPGASSTPIAALNPANLPPAAGAAPAPAPGSIPPIPGAAAAPAAPVIPATPVVPSAPFVAAPAAPLPPAAPPAPPVGKAPHKGIPYDSYRAQGWTDAQLAADGYTG